MKRLIIIMALALLISAGLTGQVAIKTLQKNQKQTSMQAQIQAKDQQQTQDRIQKQERVQDGSGVQTHSKTKVPKEERKMIKAKKIVLKKANHGQVVSEKAKSTESGPGKGEIVSTQAKAQGLTQQVRIKENNSAKNQSGFQGAHGNAVQNGIRVPARGGAGRK